MASLSCRLLPFACAAGPANMAADEVLLQTAALHGEASLRFYGWSEATVSLGYFQPSRCRLDNPFLAPLPWVRRPSGGKTLVHHHELTYALALPAGSLWQGSESWLIRMHRIIAAALGHLGVASLALVAATSPIHPFQSGGVRETLPHFEAREALPTFGRGRLGACACDQLLCFQQHTAGDLLCGQNKVVGSAQRRHRQCLLQHGGILLAGSPHTPTLVGLRDLTGLTLPLAELQAALILEWAKQTSWGLARKEWTPAEGKLMSQLVAQKYGHPGWNDKR